jgi:DNA polymerase-3 subunit epsilon
MAASADSVNLGAAALRGRVACVDLETTGGLAAHHRIIEVGIVLLEDGAVVEEWSTLVNPGLHIPPSIAVFTGIDDTMVSGAPVFEDICAQVATRLEGRTFVAHNARFDYGFLRTEFRRVGRRFSAPVLCTVRLSRAMYPEHPRHNLDTLIERFGLTCQARHRALGDAQVLPALLAAIERERGVTSLQEAVEAALREPRLPAYLPADLADDLPDAPGVYLFKDERGAPLYIGKGRNIRSRVFEHFAASRSRKEGRFAADVRQVEWIETGGELGALLLESRLLKEFAPPGNRRSRAAHDDCVVRLAHRGAGLVPEVVALADVALDGNAASVFGPFRTEKDAWRAVEGKAREARLCSKILGMEMGEGSCLAYQVHKCRGACIGREPRALHDARLQMALASLKLKPWPFDGAIGICEPAPDARGKRVHVIDRWRHLGTARNEGEIAELLRTAAPDAFDADSYRIIQRVLHGLRSRDLLLLPAPATT